MATTEQPLSFPNIHYGMPFACPSSLLQLSPRHGGPRPLSHSGKVAGIALVAKLSATTLLEADFNFHN